MRLRYTCVVNCVQSSKAVLACTHSLLAPPSNDMTKEALKRAVVLQDFTSSYNIVAKFRFDIAYVHAIHLGRTCSRQPLLAVHQYHFGLAFALACLGTCKIVKKTCRQVLRCSRLSTKATSVFSACFLHIFEAGKS